MDHVDVNGIRLAYEVRQPEHTAGPARDGVLLVMGFQARGHAWWGQAERLLAEGWPVAWFDNRGVGETQAALGRWTTKILADDALGLMDQLGWERAHVVGVSMGGMVAQEIALRPKAKGRLRSLTLVATHAGGPLDRLPTLDGLRRFARANGIKANDAAARSRERLGLLFPLHWLDSLPEEERHAVLADLKRSFSGPSGKAPSPARRLAQFSVVLSHDTRRRLRKLEGLPTMVVSPGEDLLIRPTACLGLAKRIPGAQVLRLPQAGHGVLRQCRAEVNDALVDHLARAEGLEALAQQDAAA